MTEIDDATGKIIRFGSWKKRWDREDGTEMGTAGIQMLVDGNEIWYNTNLMKESAAKEFFEGLVAGDTLKVYLQENKGFWNLTDLKVVESTGKSTVKIDKDNPGKEPGEDEPRSHIEAIKQVINMQCERWDLCAEAILPYLGNQGIEDDRAKVACIHSILIETNKRVG